MSRYFYGRQLDKSNVIYPYDKVEEYPLAQDYSLIKGFEEAADIIIQKLTVDTQVNSTNDNLVYPLLNIYICIIEFSLKLIIKHLLNHISTGCEYLECPKSSKLEKLLNHSHDLKELFKNLKDILKYKEKKHPHSNLDLKFIAIVIQAFKDNAVSLISSPHTNIKKLYPSYQRQINSEIFRFHEDIKKIIHMFLDYPKNENFRLCELQFFTTWGLEKLRETERLGSESAGLFKNLFPKKSYQDSISAIIPDLKLTDEEFKFLEEVKHFSIQKKQALLTCLYLAHRTLSQVNVENVSETEASEKIYEYKYLYQRGIDNLRVYISYIEQYL
ncbi:hypothetical protein [Legionella gresilensis]|uniref:hypothetical protein n=1 Tax=Legionella gresilensis TaxID=91823 RepID=UPI0010416A7E|nr:hypothetical protein [Legionella gresilensis]